MDKGAPSTKSNFHAITLKSTRNAPTTLLPMPSPSTPPGTPCDTCSVPFPDDRTHCPHCVRLPRYPHIQQANTPAEKAELDSRYAAAVQAAQTRGADQVVVAFEQACASSRAVICCDLEKKLLPIAKRHQDLFGNYYDLLEMRFAEEPKPNSPNWKLLRPQVEIELVGGTGSHRKLHYGNLTLTGRGLPHYGNCEILLRDDMIAHRTAVFEENSALHFHQHRRVLVGRRSDWANRAKLCVAKLGDKLTDVTSNAEFGELVLKAGAKQGLDDQFVEVLVFGELTFHAFERVVYRKTPSPKASSAKRQRAKRGSTEVKVLRDYCTQTITNGKAVEFDEQ